MNKINPTQLLYLDIETVPQYPSYLDLPGNIRKQWNKKARFIRKGNESELACYKRAGIYAEFGKIICISIGAYHKVNGDNILRIKSFYGDNEKELLNAFKNTIEQLKKKEPINFCAHNGKEFDFPYICRRMIINRVNIPVSLQVAGKKPWEITHIDTMELWRFGDYKNYTSLDLLTTVLNIPSPKTNMDGSHVGEYYYKYNNLESIKNYCEQDVLAIAQLMLVYKNKNLLDTENVEFV